MLKRNREINPKKKGQSTIEYIVLVAVVIGVLLTFATTTFRGQLQGTMNSATASMQGMGVRLGNSIPTQ